MRRYNTWYEDLVFYVNYEHAQQFEAIFYTNNVFESYFYCYRATYGPIAMKLCMAVKGQLTHVFTNFRKVSSFCLGFIGLWVYVAMPTSCKWAN